MGLEVPGQLQTYRTVMYPCILVPHLTLSQDLCCAADTMEVVEMVLGGRVNNFLVK